MILVGVPAYNEEKTICKIVKGARKYADKVLVVDDGSKDMTVKVAEQAGAIVVKHRKNLGIGPARATIFKKAKEMDADILVMLDADGQHNPDDIPRIVEPILKDEADISIGCRILNECHMPLHRKLGFRMFNKAISLAVGEKIGDTQSGFLALSKKAYTMIFHTDKGMGISVEFWHQVVRKGLVFQEVPIVINYDVENGSTFHPVRHGLSILSFLIKKIAQRHPLSFFGIPGGVLLGVGLTLVWIVIDTYFAIRKLAMGLLVLGSLGIMSGGFLILISIILYVFSDILLRIEEEIETLTHQKQLPSQVKAEEAS